MRAVCANCGREFEARTRRVLFCRRACRLAARNAEAADLAAAVVRWADPPGDAALARARSRPEWCSPARWRMELARRRDPEACAAARDEFPWPGG